MPRKKGKKRTVSFSEQKTRPKSNGSRQKTMEKPKHKKTRCRRPGMKGPGNRGKGKKAPVDRHVTIANLSRDATLEEKVKGEYMTTKWSGEEDGMKCSVDGISIDEFELLTANPTMMPPPPMVPTRIMPPAPRRQQSATKRPLHNTLNTTTTTSSSSDDDRKRRRLDGNETENLPPNVTTKTHIIFQWLKYLAEWYKGHFHEPDLDMNDDLVVNETVIPNAGGVIGSDSDEEVVELVVKSQETLLRERQAGGSSMRSTFRSISSSVTAMRGASRLQERQGVVFKESSAMVAYSATRMVLDNRTERFSIPSNEKPNGRQVKVSLHPFAQGGLRNVYRMQQALGPRQVAKESRHDIGYSERLRFHIETSKCQARAKTHVQKFNREFNKRMKRMNCRLENRECNKRMKRMNSWLKLPNIRPLGMIKTEVIRLNDGGTKGGFRYLAVESEITGKYSKWNSNNGYVNPSTCLPCKAAQAFSHFSYENSSEKEMVVDIQGGEYMYTDPQLHSHTKEFGRADRGLAGFKDFFKTHKCNDICEALQLQDRSKYIEFGPPEIKKENAIGHSTLHSDSFHDWM